MVFPRDQSSLLVCVKSYGTVCLIVVWSLKELFKSRINDILLGRCCLAFAVLYIVHDEVACIVFFNGVYRTNSRHGVDEIRRV